MNLYRKDKMLRMKFEDEQKYADVTAFIKVVRKYEHITELAPAIMHELIEKIVSPAVTELSKSAFTTVLTLP